MLLSRSQPSRIAAARARVISDLEAAGVALSASSRSLLFRSGAGVAVRAPVEGMRLTMQGKNDAVTTTADDVVVINESHSETTLTSADLVVFQDYAVSTARVPKPPVRFTRAYLEQLAEAARQGRTVLHDHQDDKQIGATFAADVLKADVRGVEADWLRIRWYAVVNDQTSAERRQVINDCRTGVLRYTSIRPSGGVWTFQEVETPDGFDYFYEIDAAPDADLDEVSRVFLGAATGAGSHRFSAPARRAANDPTPSPSPTRKVLCLS